KEKAVGSRPKHTSGSMAHRVVAEPHRISAAQHHAARGGALILPWTRPVTSKATALAPPTQYVSVVPCSAAPRAETESKGTRIAKRPRAISIGHKTKAATNSAARTYNQRPSAIAK